MPQCASNRVEKRRVLYGEKRVNLRADIAQRVGTGLRPGKLRIEESSRRGQQGQRKHLRHGLTDFNRSRSKLNVREGC